MRKTIMKTLATALALSGSLLCTTPALSETVLTVGTWLPPSDRQNSAVWPTWAKWVEEATEGRVKVKIENASVHPKSMFQLVEDGVYDASFSFHGYLPGRFKLPQIVEQPGLNANAEKASVSMWKVYQKYFSNADEFEGLKLLALFTHGAGTIQSNFKLDSLDQLRNRKIRVGGGVQTDLAEKLELTAIGGPATKAYEMLQQGVIDGIFMNLGGLKSLRLSEVVQQVTIFPRGLYMGSFSIFMNPDVFESLSEQDQQAIMSVSGEKLSALAGREWDSSDHEGLKQALEAGVDIHWVESGDPMATEFDKLIKGTDEEWIHSVESLDVDARAALAELRTLVSRY